MTDILENRSTNQYDDMQMLNNVTRGYVLAPSSRKHKIDILNGVDNEYKSYAKALMLFEFPELQALVQRT